MDDPEAEHRCRIEARDLPVVEADRALARPEETADRPQHRRLAGAVGPDHTGDLRRLRLEIEPAQHVAEAVPRDDALEDAAGV